MKRNDWMQGEGSDTIYGFCELCNRSMDEGEISEVMPELEGSIDRDKPHCRECIDKLIDKKMQDPEYYNMVGKRYPWKTSE